MILAPHPDDEVLGCGIMLQRARAVAAATRVVYVTDGENNPRPQRFLERKWRLDAQDRRRCGQLRRAECLASLRVLGHDSSCACFLGMPDQGLTSLLIKDCSRVLEAGWTEIPPLRPAEQLGAPGRNLAGRVLSTIR